jgi:hypothetical protein
MLLHVELLITIKYLTVNSEILFILKLQTNKHKIIEISFIKLYY